MKYLELSEAAKENALIQHRILYNLPIGVWAKKIADFYIKQSHDLFTSDGFFKNWNK